MVYRGIRFLLFATCLLGTSFCSGLPGYRVVLTSSDSGVTAMEDRGIRFRFALEEELKPLTGKAPSFKEYSGLMISMENTGPEPVEIDWSRTLIHVSGRSTPEPVMTQGTPYRNCGKENRTVELGPSARIDEVLTPCKALRLRKQGDRKYWRVSMLPSPLEGREVPLVLILPVRIGHQQQACRFELLAQPR